MTDYTTTEITALDGYTGSELSRAIQEKGLANVLPALDELLDAVQGYNPKLYKSFLRKL